MVRPENIEQVVVGDLRWIELYFHDFGMAGLVRAHIFVGRAVFRSACVADGRRDHTFQISKSFFHAPKTTCTKGSFVRFHCDMMERLCAGCNRPHVAVPLLDSCWW